MPHIHTLPGQHDHTVSAYIVQKLDDQYKILLHKHKKLNTLLQFGGHIELAETPWAAIAHEIEEEVGYTLAQLDVFQPHERLQECSGAVVHPTPCLLNTHTFAAFAGHYHTDLGFAFCTKELPGRPIALGESDTIIAFTREELLELSSTDIYDNTRQMCLFVLDNIVPNWVPVPAVQFSILEPII